MNGNLPKKGAGGKSGKQAKTKPTPPPKKKRAKAASTDAARKKPRRKGAPAKRTPKAPNLYHPGPLIDGQAALEAATGRLVALDPEIVGRLMAIGGAVPLRPRAPGFAGLARIIVSQQVSTASANAIFARVEAALAPLGAETLIAASDETLRACGLSSAKIRALQALAQAVVQDGLDLTGLGALVAEEAHRALVAIKGIGPWTADIFLLFCLGHPDAFPAGDIALQEAAKLVLGLQERPDARRLEEIAERWRPLRGIAARMLWSYYSAARRRSGMALASA